jgi:FAD dependent oxidoreductase TIGR03364
MEEKKFDVAIIGAGIVGLALAYQAAKKGNRVAIFERNPRAVGASIRNFGLIWPIGQPSGSLLERALRTREIWKEIASESSIWLNENGSLQLAYHEDEWDLIQSFSRTAESNGYKTRLLSPNEVINYSGAVRTDGLLGAMYSETECTVTSVDAIAQLAHFLEKKYNVQFYFGTTITHLDVGVLTDFYETWSADRIYVCSGADFETLYPQLFIESGITKCKLQMMRTVVQPNGWKLGPSLSAGLTLLHYGSFGEFSEQQKQIRERYDATNSLFSAYGIHVLVSQNAYGEIILGDSHEYGWDVSPFDKEEINQLILQYMNTFAKLKSDIIGTTWHGIYPKLQGKTEFIQEVQKDIWVVNGLSGAGMTLSFGLAEHVIK